MGSARRSGFELACPAQGFLRGGRVLVSGRMVTSPSRTRTRISGLGADDGEAAEIKEEEEGRGVDAAERAVERSSIVLVHPEVGDSHCHRFVVIFDNRAVAHVEDHRRNLNPEELLEQLNDRSCGQRSGSMHHELSSSISISLMAVAFWSRLLVAVGKKENGRFIHADSVVIVIFVGNRLGPIQTRLVWESASRRCGWSWMVRSLALLLHLGTKVLQLGNNWMRAERPPPSLGDEDDAVTIRRQGDEDES